MEAEILFSISIILFHPYLLHNNISFHFESMFEKQTSCLLVQEYFKLLNIHTYTANKQVGLEILPYASDTL